MIGPVDAISLAWHALSIGAIIFVGFLLSALVGELGVLAGLGELLADALRWTAIVTAVLYAVREA
ncbi:MAG: hypothetical protein V5A23_05375 [Halobacteriales archaeon]